MNTMIARKDLSPIDSSSILKEWVSPSGDYEVRLVEFNGWFSVTVFLVEVPEEGETIAPGEEFIETLNLIRTVNPERAEARFQEAVEAAS